MKAFVHPLSGALIEADEASLAAAYAETEAELGRIYRARAPLLEGLAELRGPAVLPKRRWQTDKQDRIATCPRCGGRPEPEPEPKEDA